MVISRVCHTYFLQNIIVSSSFISITVYVTTPILKMTRPSLTFPRRIRVKEQSDSLRGQYYLPRPVIEGASHNPRDMAVSTNESEPRLSERKIS